VKMLKNRIREFRFLNDEMTQQQLADKLEVSRQTIHAIEKGKFNPSVKLAIHIAEVFRVPVGEIFTLEDQ